MKIETISAFIAAAPELEDVLRVAYVVSFYEGYATVQGKYSGPLVNRLNQKIPMSLNSTSGYIQGDVVLSNGLRVEITLTE